MAGPLILHYGTEIPKRIAGMISDVHPSFPAPEFIAYALDGYDELPLLKRGHRIAHSLRIHLPESYPYALDILLASIGPRPAPKPGDGGMAPFLYLPHTHFVACYGLNHFEKSMQAQHQLTQRFTCEFSMRPFLEQFPEATLSQLIRWTQDENDHVRRLVSEATRPRLPWASNLPAFQQDPAPVLDLLEHLKDDPAQYVRRSVANNLNDIGKDNPAALLYTAQRWKKDANKNRNWIIRHGLRSLIKNADSAALTLLGYGETPDVRLKHVSITPDRVRCGDKTRVEFSLYNHGSSEQRLLVDLKVYYRKASGSTGPKVFKLRELKLGVGESVQVGKDISLANMSTRRHYPGDHVLTLMINGHEYPLGSFVLI